MLSYADATMRCPLSNASMSFRRLATAISGWSVVVTRTPSSRIRFAAAIPRARDEASPDFQSRFRAKATFVRSPTLAMTLSASAPTTTMI
ncbi:MAG: hypothetical protein ABJC63_09100 [Gemmatimonadales bacterium]